MLQDSRSKTSPCECLIVTHFEEDLQVVGLCSMEGKFSWKMILHGCDGGSFGGFYWCSQLSTSIFVTMSESTGHLWSMFHPLPIREEIRRFDDMKDIKTSETV